MRQGPVRVRQIGSRLGMHWLGVLAVCQLAACAVKVPGPGATQRPDAAATASAPPGAGDARPADPDVPSAATDAAGNGAAADAPTPGANAVQLPLFTCGRWIVDRAGRRVKLAGVNWYGASDTKHVVGGLDKAPLADIVATIVKLGFNTVRLPFSNVMLHVREPAAAADLAANPELAGKTPLEVFDAVVEALTRAGLFVILNNHTTHAMWCCGYDDDGLWYTSDYGEDKWLADWEMLATRYASNLRVMGADLRNELRPARTNGTILPTFVRWGGGGPTDWAAAAERGGARVLARNPNLIVFVEGIDSADNLRGVRARPVRLETPGKLAYEAHQYSFFPSPPGDILNRYGDMTVAELEAASHDKWGYILESGQPYTAPVLLGEFGDATQSAWMTNLGAYLRKLDLDFTYWPLNGGPKASGDPEPFGLLEDDWKTIRQDDRLAMLQSLIPATQGPGIDSPEDTCAPKAPEE